MRPGQIESLRELERLIQRDEAVVTIEHGKPVVSLTKLGRLRGVRWPTRLAEREARWYREELAKRQS